MSRSVDYGCPEVDVGSLEVDFGCVQKTTIGIYVKVTTESNILELEVDSGRLQVWTLGVASGIVESGRLSFDFGRLQKKTIGM